MQYDLDCLLFLFQLFFLCIFFKAENLDIPTVLFNLFASVLFYQKSDKNLS